MPQKKRIILVLIDLFDTVPFSLEVLSFVETATMTVKLDFDIIPVHRAFNYNNKSRSIIFKFPIISSCRSNCSILCLTAL